MEVSTQGLLVSRKAEALLNEIYPSLRNYPKAEKFALCEEIKEAFYGLIKNLELASAVNLLRKRYAQEADGCLQTIKILMRLSRNQHYISKGFYAQIDTALTEISKLLHGYIVASAAK